MKFILFTFLLVLTNLSIAQKKHWINSAGIEVKKDVATNYYTLSKTEMKTYIYKEYSKETDSLFQELNYPTKERLSKEGAFKRYFENGKLAVEGSYLNDLKTGVWKFYNRSGFLTTSISYQEGVKDGQQIDYYKNEKPEAIYWYKNGSLNRLVQFYSELDSLIFKEDTTDIAVYTFVDQEAIFPGGEKALELFLKQYSNSSKKVEVYTSFNIDTNGRVSEIHKNKLTNIKISDSYIKQAFKVLANLPQWEPAMKRGRLVKSRQGVKIIY